MPKAKFIGLLPIIVFLILFIGVGVFTGDIYAMPAVVGFIIALIVAFMQNPKIKFAEKLQLVAKGIGDDNIVTMLFVFILSGVFSGIVKASGGVESTVNFGLSIIPPNLMVVGIFIVGCFISVSMGTSVGTISTLAPIAVGIADATELSLPMCIGAVVCGAMFGDNLSMISDTTIAAVRTQGCNMKDKFKTNFLIVLPAAIITIVIFFALTSKANFVIPNDLEYSFVKILPYLLVLIGALIGINVFVVLISGIVLSGIVGLSTGMFTFSEMFGHMNTGASSMYEITVISIIVAAIFQLVKANGGVQFIINLIKKFSKGKRGAQIGIAFMSVLVDLCTANNTIAIVMTGPIAKEIGDEYDIEPKKMASVLDIFTSAAQGVLPYGAQLLTAATAASAVASIQLSPVEILPYLYYPILMAVVAVIAILFTGNKSAKIKSKEVCKEAVNADAK